MARAWAATASDLGPDWGPRVPTGRFSTGQWPAATSSGESRRLRRAGPSLQKSRRSAPRHGSLSLVRGPRPARSRVVSLHSQPGRDRAFLGTSHTTVRSGTSRFRLSERTGPGDPREDWMGNARPGNCVWPARCALPRRSVVNFGANSFLALCVAISIGTRVRWQPVSPPATGRAATLWRRRELGCSRQVCGRDWQRGISRFSR